MVGSMVPSPPSRICLSSSESSTSPSLLMRYSLPKAKFLKFSYLRAGDKQVEPLARARAGSRLGDEIPPRRTSICRTSLSSSFDSSRRASRRTGSGPPSSSFRTWISRRALPSPRCPPERSNRPSNPPRADRRTCPRRSLRTAGPCRGLGAARTPPGRTTPRTAGSSASAYPSSAGP